MTYRLTNPQGMPRRLRVLKERRNRADHQLEQATRHLDRVVPFQVRIEIAGGRTSTASAMRAARVQQELEGVGATAWTVSLEGSEATVHAEVDRDQLEHAARLAFVRRISLS